MCAAAVLLSNFALSTSTVALLEWMPKKTPPPRMASSLSIHLFVINALNWISSSGFECRRPPPFVDTAIETPPKKPLHFNQFFKQLHIPTALLFNVFLSSISFRPKKLQTNWDSNKPHGLIKSIWIFHSLRIQMAADRNGAEVLTIINQLKCLMNFGAKNGAAWWTLTHQIDI